jgi:hypothetical protein
MYRVLRVPPGMGGQLIRARLGHHRACLELSPTQRFSLCVSGSLSADSQTPVRHGSNTVTFERRAGQSLQGLNRSLAACADRRLLRVWCGRFCLICFRCLSLKPQVLDMYIVFGVSFIFHGLPSLPPPPSALPPPLPPPRPVPPWHCPAPP